MNAGEYGDTMELGDGRTCSGAFFLCSTVIGGKVGNTTVVLREMVLSLGTGFFFSSFSFSGVEFDAPEGVADAEEELEESDSRGGVFSGVTSASADVLPPPKKPLSLPDPIDINTRSMNK